MSAHCCECLFCSSISKYLGQSSWMKVLKRVSNSRADIVIMAGWNLSESTSTFSLSERKRSLWWTKSWFSSANSELNCGCRYREFVPGAKKIDYPMSGRSTFC